MTDTHVDPAQERTLTTDLAVGGMTCASCAARVEKRLNRLDGVVATVNFATAQAHVDYPERLDPYDLVATVEAAGYSATLPLPPRTAGSREPGAGEPAAGAAGWSALRRRLLVSAPLAAVVLLLGMVPALQVSGWQWWSLVLAAPVVTWGAWPFHHAAWTNLRHGATTMDTLISLGVSVAYVWSAAVLLLGRDQEVYFEVAAVVTVLILTGRLLEARATYRSGDALRALLARGAKDAARLVDDGARRTEERVPIDQLAVGDLFVVRPGENVATDGVVVEGASDVDRSLLTGESVPVPVGPGDAVVGATTNAGGRLVVRATRVGADTRLAQIGRLVTQAQTGKAPVQRLADRVSAVFVPVVLVVAAGTLVAWLASGATASTAVSAAVAVLIVACPCALGLATPTALLVGTGRAAQLGILIKGPQVLESTRVVDTVVLDKTGTVTVGRPALTSVVVAHGVDERELLRRAGAVEEASEHPLAQAVAAGATARLGVDLPPVAAFASVRGQGVSGEVDGEVVVAGRPSWVQERIGSPVPGKLEAAAAAAMGDGQSVVLVGWGTAVRGLLTVADSVKPGAAAAVDDLRALGLQPMLLTGDGPQAARAVAHAVGIDEVVADVRPEGKVAAVGRLQGQGRVVAMVGDGVNDAAALAAADLGIAMGTGADVAIEASDLTVVSGELGAVATAVRLSRSTLRTIKGNLFWAFAYNVAALPLAAAGRLSPMLAGAAMAFSSVFVVTNSLRLRRFRP